MDVVTYDQGRGGARAVLTFGSFRLCPDERWLEKDGRRVDIGSRMFELLTAFVERAGQTITKQELLARVWSGRTVDEGSLRVQVAGLR